MKKIGTNTEKEKGRADTGEVRKQKATTAPSGITVA